MNTTFPSIRVSIAKVKMIKIKYLNLVFRDNMKEMIEKYILPTQCWHAGGEVENCRVNSKQ